MESNGPDILQPSVQLSKVGKNQSKSAQDLIEVITSMRLSAIASLGLRRNALFHQLLQALIEMAEVGSDERSLLESISNHIAARSGTDQLALRFNDN